MSDNEEKTIVIDIEKLKRELNIDSIQGANKAKGGDKIDQSIEFSPNEEQKSRNEPAHIPESNQSDQLDITEVISMEDMQIKLTEELTSSPVKEIKMPMVFFDYKSNYFSSSLKIDQDHLFIATTLQQINEKVKDREPKMAIFNYMVQPHTVNQLMKQLRSKFPHIKRVIVGKKLSPSRIQMHQKSPYGADFYLDLDQSKDIIGDLERIISSQDQLKSA